MLNTSDILRGYTDTIILSHLAAGDSYGYEINKGLAQATGGRLELKEATLYTTFRRLEQGGMITSYWGDEQAGARRRYYSITPQGRLQDEEHRRDWEAIKAILDQLLAPGGASNTTRREPV